MNVDRSLEKQYTLLIEGLSLEEKSWLYNRAKRDGSSQSKVMLGLLRESMKAGVQ